MARKRRRSSASRSAAAKKAARTRKRNAAKRSAAARKAARTRKRHHRANPRKRVSKRRAHRRTRRANPRRRVHKRRSHRRTRRANPRRRVIRRRRRANPRRGLARRRRDTRGRFLNPMGKRELRKFRSRLAKSRKRVRHGAHRGAFKNPFDRHGFWHRVQDGEFGSTFGASAKMHAKRSRFAKRVAKGRKRSSASGRFLNPSRRRKSRGLSRMHHFGRFGAYNPSYSNPRRKTRKRRSHKRYANPFRDVSGRMHRNDGKFAKSRKRKRGPHGTRVMSRSEKRRHKRFMGLF